MRKWTDMNDSNSHEETEWEMLKRMRDERLDVLLQTYGTNFTISDLLSAPKRVPSWHLKWERLMLIRKARIREALSPSIGVHHKLQSLWYVKWVEYIDDSQTTNRNALWFALESINKPIVLIIGWMKPPVVYPIPDRVSALMKEKVKTVIALWLNNEWLKHILIDHMHGIHFIETHTMKDAVSSAQQAAETGDAVLLSPAAASFDLFKHYEARWDAFQEEVKYL